MKKTRRHVLNRPWMYRAGATIVRSMPRWFNSLWVRRVADLNHHCFKEHRKWVSENLAPVVGSDPKVLAQTTRSLFRNYAEVMVDYAVFFGGRGTRAVTGFKHADGYEHIEKALQQKRGVILITAHLGFWELGGLYFMQQGLPVFFLTTEDPDPGVHDERVRIRSSLGIRTITVQQNPWTSLEAARALRQNAVVALAVDRYDGPGAVPVELFGRRTFFAPGPALFARMTGAAVIPAFVPATGPGRYRGLILPRIPMEFSSDREADNVKNTQRIARVVEQVIRAYPDQWYNFQTIWREE